MRWFISALIILGILAGSLYAVNREDKSVYVLVVRAMISATIRNHIFSSGSQSRFAGDVQNNYDSLLTCPTVWVIIGL